jgi:hypothetical protein
MEAKAPEPRDGPQPQLGRSWSDCSQSTVTKDAMAKRKKTSKAARRPLREQDRSEHFSADWKITVDSVPVADEKGASVACARPSTCRQSRARRLPR